MKKFFTSVILFLLLMQSAGMLLVFFYSTYSHKREMREFLSGNINEKNLELIKLSFLTTKTSNSNFQRLDDGEIALGTKRYDVFKEEVRSDTVYFYCLRDEKEEEMYSSLDNIFLCKLNAKIPAANLLSQILNVAATYFYSEQSCDSNFSFSLKSYFPSSPTHYLSVILDKDSPPPRIS